MIRHHFTIWTECSKEGRVYAVQVGGLIRTAKTLAEIESMIAGCPKVCPCKKAQKSCVGYEGPAR